MWGDPVGPMCSCWHEQSEHEMCESGLTAKRGACTVAIVGVETVNDTPRASVVHCPCLVFEGVGNACA